MKKRSRKLQLNRETLRNLDPAAVSRVAGASGECDHRDTGDTGDGGGETIETGPFVPGCNSFACTGLTCAFCNPTEYPC